MGGVFSVLSLDQVLLTSSLYSPGRSRPGLSWVSTSPVCSSGASSSVELDSAQSFHSVCSLRHILAFVRCELGSSFVSSPGGTSWLGPSGLAIFASIPLVSRPWTVLSWSPLRSLSSVSDCLMVVPRQLIGLGEYSPASPICLTSRVRKRSFGFSA